MCKLSALFLCGLFAVVLAFPTDQAMQESKQRLKDAVTKCRASFPDDKDINARIYCFSKNAGWQNEQGVLNKDVIRKRAEALFPSQEKVEEVYNDCAQEQDTPEHTALHVLTCYQKYVNVDI